MRKLALLALQFGVCLGLVKVLVGVGGITAGASGHLLAATETGFPPLVNLWLMLAFGAASVVLLRDRPLFAALLACIACAYANRPLFDLGLGEVLRIESFSVPALWAISLYYPDPVRRETVLYRLVVVMLASSSGVAVMSTFGLTLRGVPSPFSNDTAHWGLQAALGFPALLLLGHRCFVRSSGSGVYAHIVAVAMFPLAANMLLAFVWPGYVQLAGANSLRVPVVLWLSVAPIAVLVGFGARHFQHKEKSDERERERVDGLRSQEL